MPAFQPRTANHIPAPCHRAASLNLLRCGATLLPAMLLTVVGVTCSPLAAAMDLLLQLPSTWSRSFDSFQHEDRVLLVRAAGAGGVLQLLRAYDPKDLNYYLLMLRYEADGQLTWSRVDSFPPVPGLALDVEPDGSALLAAVTQDQLLLRKFDSVSGDLIWEHHRPLSISVTARDLDSAVLARDGQQIRVAMSDADDFLIASYSEDGTPGADVRWGLVNSVDVPTAMVPREGGGFVVTGYENGRTGAAAYRTLAFDSQGTLLFSQRETGPIGNLFTPAWLGQDTAGNTYVAGGPESSCGTSTYQIWKLSPSGQRLWSHAGPASVCDSIAPIGFSVRADGAATVVSQTGLAKFGLNRINADGGEDWARQWGGPGGGDHAVPRAFAVNADGGIRVTGTRPAVPSNNLLLAEWADDGTLCGTHQSNSNSGEAIAVLDGGWIVGSDSQFSQSTNVDAELTRYPALECVLDRVFADAFEAAGG
jgi:hypothetical protein